MPKPRMRRAMKNAGPIDWKTQNKYDYRFARQMMLEYGECQPMFIVHGRDGEMYPVMAAFTNREEKALTMKMVTMICVAYAAGGVSFIGEAWAATGMAEDRDNPTNPRVMPSDREDKREVIIAQLSYRTDSGVENVFMSGDIERSPDGKVSGFSHENENAHTAIGGAFCDVLPPEVPNEFAQKAAKMMLEFLEQRGGLKISPLD